MSLIGLLIAVIVAGFIWWVIDLLPIAEPFNRLAKGLLVLILLIAVIYALLPLLSGGGLAIMP